MYILIAVASRHGGTHEIAASIGEELRRAGHTVLLQPIEASSTIASPDAAIIGSAVYMGDWLPEARQFVERSWLRLAGVPTWLFSSGLLSHSDPPSEGYPAQLDALLANTGAREHRVFAGRLDKQNLGIGERLITRVVNAPEGDFRDWGEIRAWAREIAATLAYIVDTDHRPGAAPEQGRASSSER